MKNERKFRIVFEAESGLTDEVRVDTEGEVTSALINLLQRQWGVLIAGDTIKIIEEE